MKKIFALCPVLVILAIFFSQSVFAEGEKGYVTFTRNGNVYADISETVSLERDVEHTAVSDITINEDETVDISVKQNTMFYNNGTWLGFFGYSLKTTNNNSNGNVSVTLYKGSEQIANATVDKTTFSNPVNGIYVSTTTTVNVTYAPDYISVNVKGTKGTAVMLENVAISGRDTTGDITIKSGGTSASYRKLYSVKVSSGLGEVVKSSFLMDKKFSAVDNKSDLTADGYSLTSVDTYSDSVGLARHSTSGSMSVIYKETPFSGAYTLEIEAAKAHNEGYVYFNYVDSDNYYRITTKSTASTTATLRIEKRVNGSDVSLLTDDTGATVGSKAISMGTNGDMKYKVVLLPDETTGDLQITVTMVHGNASKIITVTDKKTDTNSPITSGGVGYGNSWVNINEKKENYVKSIKVYPGTYPVAVTGAFKNSGEETDIYSAGETTFGLPVSLIGDKPKLLAALYNETQIVAVRQLDFSQVNSGDVKLFDEEGTKIKIFMWDSLVNNRPTDSPFELPKRTKAEDYLDGKKVLFIGDSYVYYGRTVESKYTLTQSSRSNDQGGFYQLCKANGIDVSVTNWTFSAHGLREIFDGACTETTCTGYGENHEDYLIDRYFDYVVVSPTRGADIDVDFGYIMDFFRSANPNVKFVCLGSAGIHGISKNDVVYEDIIAYYQTLEEQGVIIADWGEMVNDIIKGRVSVPGATQAYDRSTFVVKDNYHPNLLTGYLTTLFAYCAITGDMATEQTYSYINDGSASSVFDMQSYLEEFYDNGDADTNFPEVLASEADMKGLQQLVEGYLGSRGKVMLNNKKIIFIGNSYTYWGRAVLNKTYSVLTQTARSNDQGYFYQLCKKMGADVAVTNWTFGKHGLGSIFGAPCTINEACLGENHEDYLIEPYFDYVVIQPGIGNESATNLIANVEYIMNFFREANPNVKFLMLGNSSAYGYNATDTVYESITSQYKKLDEMGLVIADWGRIIKGVLTGENEVPGATQTYNKSSFIVDDGYHPNMLTGYMTALITYCAITGETAVGKPYDFCGDTAINSTFDMEEFKTGQYTKNETNFIEIFESESDMNGIQQLIDKGLAAKLHLVESES